MNPLFHIEQLVRLTLQHLGHRNAGPAGDEPGDILLVHHLVNLLSLEPVAPGLVILLLQAQPLTLEPGGVFVVLAL